MRIMEAHRSRTSVRCFFSLLLKKAVKAAQIEKAEGQLACQEPPEVSGDTEVRYGKEYKEETDCQADNIHGENMSRHAQSLKNAGECGIQVEERADKS